MTAEVAVFNSYGIALAADSAVTTSLGGAEKIYNNADKLFQLSKVNPIAIMIYNIASINGSPWELLIKAFKAEFGDTDYSTVADCAKAFFSFAVKKRNIITEEHTTSFVKNTFKQVIYEFLDRFQQNEVVQFIMTSQRQPTPAECHVMMCHKIDNILSDLNEVGFYENFSQDDIDRSISENYMFSKEVCMSHLPLDFSNAASPLPNDLLEKFNKLFANSLCKDFSGGMYTGLVFAGYGSDEYYPYLESHKIYGIYNNKLMASKVVENNNEASSGIMPFAQDDEVNTFMKGCSSGMYNCITGAINTNLEILGIELADILTSNNANVTKDEVINALNSLRSSYIDNYNNTINNYMISNHVHKVISILGVLAKPDLGYMAESLVNLTAFKRKVSNDSDTVGGPIDVAILSKGDGFIWLKRKHYFNKDLNYNFHNRQLTK